MKARNNILIYITLVIAWAILLIVQHLVQKYFSTMDILLNIVGSISALPLFVLIMVFVVGLFTENREQKARRQQLLQIKSCMFRLEMRDLFTVNFFALKTPYITINSIKEATLDDLIKIRAGAGTVQYKSLEAMEPVIMEYVKAEPVWRNFMNIALNYNFADIFQEMVHILHFIGDVKSYKAGNPDKLFIYQAANDEQLMQKTLQILGDGIRKYLDYVIELKEKQPDLFTEIIRDYELSA